MRLLRLLEEGRREDAWYSRLWDGFKRGAKNDPEFFNKLSAILGHDPEFSLESGDSFMEDGEEESDFSDGLSPEALKEDIGWAWDSFREEILPGRGKDDINTAKQLLELVGVNTATAPTEYGELTLWLSHYFQ